MTPASKALTLRALDSFLGDDFYRCERAFVAFLPREMDEQHGESGKTRREILDGYRAHHDACIHAIVEVKALP